MILGEKKNYYASFDQPPENFRSIPLKNHTLPPDSRTCRILVLEIFHGRVIERLRAQFWPMRDAFDLASAGL